jgi:hypothetical protein
MAKMYTTCFNFRVLSLPKQRAFGFVLFTEERNTSLKDFNWLAFLRGCNVFLGAFAKLRKATISFVMCVRLSVRTEQLGSHWTDFH